MRHVPSEMDDAGLATLLSNAVPIVAGLPARAVPSGPLAGAGLDGRQRGCLPAGPNPMDPDSRTPVRDPRRQANPPAQASTYQPTPCSPLMHETGRGSGR